MHNFMSLSSGWKLVLVSVSLIAIGLGAVLMNS